MSEFAINAQNLPNGIVALSLKGFLDAYTYEQLEQTINGYFDNKMYRIVVDMGGVDYISSAGAGVFIGAIGIAQENRGNIVIIRPTQSVKEVFDLLGLTQIFPITANMESAIKILEA